MNVTKHLAVVAALLAALAGCSSEETKTCSDFCGDGAACVDGQCVALSQDCSPACATNEACLLTGGAPACVAVCGAAQVWNASTQQCDLQISMDHSRYFGGFTDAELVDGPTVTAQCLNCHALDAAQMAGSAHFKWLGPTPLLAGHEADTAAVGKKNLVNNFCIAVASNETRCTQCHAGYGDPGTAATAGTPGYDLTELGRVDCLVCHADMSTGYVKATANWGAADVAANSSACGACGATQVCWDDGVAAACVEKSARFRAAAQSVGRPSRSNCGYCHFYAGGGDNVKMGDLASSLKAPTMAVDVHMGSDGGNMVCVDCHVTSAHRIFGAGVSVAVSEGRTACVDCHDTAAATFTAVSTHRASHLAKIACQTCHIPAFSRQLRTKTRWEWSSAGYKDCKFPVTAADELLWGDLDTDGNGYADALACAAPAASPSASWTGADGEHYEYDWRKGVFLKQDQVAPTYRYFDGKGLHLTISDGFTEAGTAADPVIIAAPTATEATAGAKIFPFKEMQGTQAALADGGALLVPYLYPMKDDAGATVPGALWAATTLAASGETVGSLQGKWNTLLTVGARKAGQIGAADTLDDAAWGWVETRMYMNLNHEVAPKAQALGAASCNDCHSGGAICGLPGVACPF